MAKKYVVEGKIFCPTEAVDASNTPDFLKDHRGPPVGSGSRARIMHALRAARKLLRALFATGTPLPKSTYHKGVSRARFAEYAKIEPEFAYSPALRALTDRVAEKLGTAVWVRAPGNRSPRLDEAQRYACRRLVDTNTAASRPRDTDVARLREVFARAANGKHANMSRDAREALAELAAKVAIGRKGLPANLKRHLEFAVARTEELAETGGVAEDFRERFAHAFRMSGITFVELAKRSGVHQATIKFWFNGRIPSATSLPAVKACEKALKLETGYLTKPLGEQISTCASDFDDDIQGVRFQRLRKMIRAELPKGWRKLTQSARRELTRKKRAVIEGRHSGGSWRRKIYDQGRYALTEWPAGLQAEWEMMLRHHRSGDVPGFSYPATLHWASEETVELQRLAFTRMFGFFLIDTAERHKLQPKDLSLSLLADPNRVKRLIDFQRSRVAKSGGPDGHSRAQAQVMGLCANLFERPGFIRQWQPMRDKLGYGRKPDDWERFCDKIASDYRYREKLVKSKAIEKRDPRANLAATFEMPRPLTAVKLLVNGMRKALKPVQRTDRFLCRHQQLVYTVLHAQVPLRQHTTVQLTWDPDKRSGHLRRDGRGYYLAAPPAIFKNGDGQALRDGLRRRLHNRWGLTKLLDFYINEVRPSLLAGQESPYLFVFGGERYRAGCDALSKRKRAKQLASQFRSWTRQVCETLGIDGFEQLSPTDLRDIVATDLDRQEDERHAKALEAAFGGDKKAAVVAAALGRDPERGPRLASTALNNRASVAKKHYIAAKRRDDLFAAQTVAAEHAAESAAEASTMAAEFRRGQPKQRSRSVRGGRRSPVPTVRKRVRAA